MASASNADAQTLFAKPDTTPDYRAYQHIEECMAAALRITDIEKSLRRDTIWLDTIPWYDMEELKEKLNLKNEREERRPESAIKAVNICLEKFNADTVKILSGRSAIRVIKILLMAHRDQDAEKFTQRFLDSLRRESDGRSYCTVPREATPGYGYKDCLNEVLVEYMVNARPARPALAKQYATEMESVIKAGYKPGDSLYRAIDVALELSGLANRMKDTAAAEAAQQLAVTLNDSMSEEERKNSPRSGNRLFILANIVVKNTSDEALDSLAVSTLAYNLWYANTVKNRIYGGKVITKDDEQVQPKKLPELTGDYYYTANSAVAPGASAQSKSTYTKEGAVHKGEFPIKNSVNFIVGLPNLCYTETDFRGRYDKGYKLAVVANSCLRHASMLRGLKRNIPDAEIIGLTNTYGTVGQLFPLTPDQEADTLAKLFLEFHSLPVRLIVEKTEFVHLAEPDGRRIDFDTPNSENLEESVKSYELLRIVDKEGYVIDNLRTLFQIRYGPIIGGLTTKKMELLKRLYEVLKNRPTK